MLEVVLCGLCGLMMLFLWCRNSKQADVIDDSKLPPGSLGWPLIGESISLAIKKAGFFRERHDKHGRIFKTHLFGKHIIRVYGSDNLRKVILGENKYVQSYYPASVRALMGEQSITMSSGEIHELKRKQMIKLMNLEFLHNHIPIITHKIAMALQSWCDKPNIDLFVETRKLFIEIAAKFLIKIDIDQQDVDEIIKQFNIFTGNVFCLPFNFPGFGFYKALQAKKRLREIFVRVLNKSNGNNNTSGGLCSVLEELRASDDKPVDVERDQLLLDAMIELLFLGAETLTTSGFSVAYELLKNPSCLEKAKRCIEEQNLLDPYESISAHDLHEMKYVQAVVNETLRLLPPVGGGYREVTESFELEGYTIPKGWSVVFSIRETQHNDPSREDPMAFNPDHWLEAGSHTDKYSWLPFGAGARKCTGHVYASMVLNLFAVELVRNCSATLVQDSELVLFPSPRPVRPILVNACRLNGQQSV